MVFFATQAIDDPDQQPEVLLAAYVNLRFLVMLSFLLEPTGHTRTHTYTLTH